MIITFSVKVDLGKSVRAVSSEAAPVQQTAYFYLLFNSSHPNILNCTGHLGSNLFNIMARNTSAGNGKYSFECAVSLVLVKTRIHNLRLLTDVTEISTSKAKPQSGFLF